jgi:parallel beta-helix repeat protein
MLLPPTMAAATGATAAASNTAAACWWPPTVHFSHPPTNTLGLLLLLRLLAVAVIITPAPAQGSSSGLDLEVWHSGGGLTSAVMRDIIEKLPPLPTLKPLITNGSALMRTVHLDGAYKADTALVLPSFTRLVLAPGSTVTPTLALGANPHFPRGNFATALVVVFGQRMVAVEGGSWDCNGWTSSNASTNTSTLAGIWFYNVTGGLIKDLTIRGCGNPAPAGPSPNYVTGNIWVSNGGYGNTVSHVESSHSFNRGIWAEAHKLLVLHSTFHHNAADGIDFDAYTSKSVAYNNTCYNNSRHGIFLEEGASENTIIGNTCHSNAACALCQGSNVAGMTVVRHGSN